MAPQTTRAYAAQGPDSGLAPWHYEPRRPRPDDVSIDILYCGVCHTDIHFVENDWGMTVYPVVPGHEIIGRVTAVGSEVTGFKAGDMVGVGCLVDSCRECSSCRHGLEQYCINGAVFTYNGVDRHDGKPYIACLGVDGAYLLLGQLTPLQPPVEAMPLIMDRRSIMGSVIGGLPETQEVLDFCAEHGIRCDIEMLDIRNIGEAYERIKRGDVRYRFVIDMATLKEG